MRFRRAKALAAITTQSGYTGTPMQRARPTTHLPTSPSVPARRSKRLDALLWVLKAEHTCLQGARKTAGAQCTKLWQRTARMLSTKRIKPLLICIGAHTLRAWVRGALYSSKHFTHPSPQMATHPRREVLLGAGHLLGHAILYRGPGCSSVLIK